MELVEIVKIQRPTGWLGTLYDKVCSYSKDPVLEIKRIADQALNDGVLDQRMYEVLQYRIPFPEFKHESLKYLSGRFERTRERARQLERILYEKLMRYVLENYDREELLNSSIYYLPWNTRGDLRAIGALKTKLGIGTSINDVLKLFNETAKNGGYLGVRNFKEKSLHATYELFKKVKIDLPELFVVKPHKQNSLTIEH